jgi:hypothetical protein
LIPIKEMFGKFSMNWQFLKISPRRWFIVIGAIGILPGSTFQKVQLCRHIMQVFTSLGPHKAWLIVMLSVSLLATGWRSQWQYHSHTVAGGAISPG